MGERKSFTTSIDIDVQRDFKSACAKNGVKMNDLLETIMKEYCNGSFELTVEYKTIRSSKQE